MCELGTVNWPAWLTAVFAGLTVLVYIRMNRILAETNRISEAMVRETRRNRYSAVAPKVELKFGPSTKGFNNDLSVPSSDSSIRVIATNTSERKAYAVTLLEPVVLASRPRDLNPKDHTQFEVRRTDPATERFVVSFYDEFGNRWETIWKDGRHIPRLAEEVE
jgi:hypothetical protein